MAEWKIGPTFVDECRAAGIDMNGWSWSIFDGNFAFNADVPQATRDAVATVYAAHDPAAQTDPPTVPYPPGSAPVTVPPPPPPPPPPEPLPTRWLIDRQVVIERLEAVHRFGAFMDVLDDSNQLTRELWAARYRVWNDDPLVVGLIQQASADPAAILARP
jgi:hypothetical protein